MICVSVLTASSGEIVGFSLKGHADYGEQGNDIVCAAVSSAAYLVANTVTDVLHIHGQVLVEDDGSLYLRVSGKDAIRCRDLFAGFKLHLVGLEEQYPENIQVNYLEV
ncbi:MAG: ribosomal-processing cysteine protease Prp [Oscillospiraceae bacterium]|nr:ribosomal-processing cysteine protease Prp [Oscillospiraceae bacterium]